MNSSIKSNTSGHSSPGGTMLGKQRQLASDTQETNRELQLSFKNSSSLAKGLTKERVAIQNEFQKIAGGTYNSPKNLSFLCSQVSTWGPKESKED